MNLQQVNIKTPTLWDLKDKGVFLHLIFSNGVDTYIIRGSKQLRQLTNNRNPSESKLNCSENGWSEAYLTKTPLANVRPNIINRTIQKIGSREE